MIKFSSVLFLSLMAGACQHGKSELSTDHTKAVVNDNVYVITLHVTQTTSYCGGAAPNDEILQELGTPRPMDNKRIHIKRGDSNNPDDAKGLFTGVTDANGSLDVLLPPGIYCAVFDDKNDRTYFKELMNKYENETASYNAIDKDCLEEWIQNPECVLNVEVGKPMTFSFNKNQPCSWDAIPCVDYTGPLPP